VEILEYLFVCDRHNVAAVSRRLRSLALNTAHLWRYINLDGSLLHPSDQDSPQTCPELLPLHIRATDYHLREIRPSLPHTDYSLGPSVFISTTFHHHLHKPFIQISHHHRPFTHMSHLHQACFIHNVHPIQPTPIPLKSPTTVRQYSISRAAVLDIVSQKYQSAYNLEIEPLTVPMPHTTFTAITFATSVRLTALLSNFKAHSILPLNHSSADTHHYSVTFQ
jgi:hypothetical protein